MNTILNVGVATKDSEVTWFTELAVVALPEKILGIARNTREAFCYLILTEPDDGNTAQVLACSVIQQIRYEQDPAQIVKEPTCKVSQE